MIRICEVECYKSLLHTMACDIRMEINQYDIKMATHYDITMGKDIGRDVHCEITMGNELLGTSIVMSQ